ncbi:MAG: restriction endonuclease subunit S [Gammaproteobacteria bacterium]|nr:MAG: restriction endonuclease subunit S [Gammaproteobacteria bacterium]
MNWPQKKLELLASNERYSFIGGPFGSKLTSRDYVDHGIPVIRGSNLNNGRYLDMNDFVYVSDSKVREDLSSNLAKPLDLVFTQRGTLGQVAIIPNDGISDRYVVSQSQMKLTVDDSKADRIFIYYYFSSREAIERIMSFTSSSGVPHINLTVLRNFEVPVPPIETQKHIATILSGYDDLIENNRRRIQLLEQSARLLYKEWFVHLRFPGHEHVKIKDGVPEGWEKTTVGNVSSFISRGITPKYDEDALGTVINQKCIRDQRVTMDLARRQSREVPPRKLVIYGDVLVNSTGQGTLGRVAQFLDGIENCTVDSHITIARPNEDVPIFLYSQHITSMEDYLASMGRGATNQTELSKDVVAELPFLQPPHLLAEQFESFAKDTADQVRNLTQQNAMLTKARDLLLPRLMNGEVVV